MASPHGIVEAGYKISEGPSPWAELGGEKNLNGSGNKNSGGKKHGWDWALKDFPYSLDWE